MFGCTSVKLSAGMRTFQISFLIQHHNRVENGLLGVGRSSKMQKIFSERAADISSESKVSRCLVQIWGSYDPLKAVKCKIGSV